MAKVPYFIVLTLVTLSFTLSPSFAKEVMQLPTGAIKAAPYDYPDVPKDHWAYQALRTMTDIGIFTGYPNGSFQGNNTLTRYEVSLVAARLVDYVDAMFNAISGDPEFADRLKQVAAELQPLGSMDRRVNAVEDSMNNAASLEYVQNLETRIIALERAMNELLGEERFSADMTNASDMPLTAAAATTGSASGFGVQRPSVDGGLNGADVRFRNDNPYPFYVGFSPGIVSTSGGVYFGAQVGYDGIVGPVGAVTRLTFNSAADELRLSFDATVRVQAFDEKLELYGGMGPGFTFRPSGTSFLFEVPFGAEYLVTEQVGVFMQLTTSYAFKPINQVDSSLSTGINLRF